MIDSEEVKNFSKNSKIRRVYVGGKQVPQPEDKVVLLFGSKTVGKTTTISSILNFLYDVKKHYNFRFIIDKNTEPTDELVEYVISNSVLPYSVTFVDTPGLVDVDGYIETSSIIREWFEERLLQDGQFYLDAITIVLRSNDEELSWPYIHELAAVKRMFGDDLKVNVLPIITFSEILPQPLAVRAMANANITFLEYYKIDNAGFFNVNRKINGIDSSFYYDHGMQSFKRYFTVSYQILFIQLQTDTASFSGY
uniref:G domain-containing protein n=1 Tax=Syphacia muris TaxID=451379 RepID=A0A0N5A7L8_9BILA